MTAKLVFHAILLCVLSEFTIATYEFSLPNELHAQMATPFPTEIPANANLLPTIEALLRENGGCELPCWWGFDIGETPEDEWLSFLADTELDSGYAEFYLDEAMERRGGDIQYYLVRPFVDFRIGFGLEEANLSYLIASFYDANDWLSSNIETITLPGVLAQLEETPDIYMKTDSLGQWSWGQMDFYLISDEAGLVIWYTIDTSNHLANPIENIGDPLLLCLGIPETTFIQFRIQDPSATPSFREQMHVEEIPELHTLDETLGIDNETFIEFFRENPDGCLEVSYLRPASE
jgi:hypothetical protein